MRQPHFALAPLTLVALLAIGFAGAAHAQPKANAPVAIHIAAQPLGLALNELARQAALQLFFPPALVAGKTAPAVSGTLTPHQAVDRLLAGSGLMAVPDGAALIIRAAAVSSAGATLPEVRVSAAVDPVRSGLAAEGYRVSDSSLAGFAPRALKETPLSVRVIPSELIVNQGLTNIGKLAQLDASVSNSFANWFSGPQIRGFDLSFSENYRRDGLSMNHQYSPGLENKERVEILKGLSGLQSGFSSPGGVINYVTKRPEEISEVHLTANQFGNLKAHVDLGRMPTENFGYRLNVAVEEQRNHIDHVRGPRALLAGAVTWAITPDTRLDLDIEHEQGDKTFQPALTLNTDGRIPAIPKPSTFYGQRWATFDTESTVLGAKLEQRLGAGWSVTAAVSHQNLERAYDWFGFGSIDRTGNATVNLFDQTPEQRRVTNAQLTAKGRVEWVGVRHDLAVGLENSHEKDDWAGGTAFVTNFGTTNLYAPVELAKPGVTYGGAGGTEFRRSGFFINDVIALGERWDVHLGGRYARIDNRSHASGVTTNPYEKSKFTPTLAVVFKPTASLSTYLSYTEGLQAGNTAPLGASNANQVMAPLVSKQLEAGVKGTAGLVDWELSVFGITKPAQYLNGAKLYVQTGEQLHKGLELSVSGKPTRELTLFGSAMLLDAEMKETGDPRTTGKRPTGTPKQSVALTAEYAPMAVPGWTFAANWTRSGDRAVDATNTVFAPGYNLFSLGLRHQRRVAGKNLTLRLHMDNVFDKRYWASAKNRFLEVGAPRTVWAGVSASF